MDTKPLGILLFILLGFAGLVLAAVIIVIHDNAMYSDIQEVQNQEDCLNIEDRVVLPNE